MAILRAASFTAAIASLLAISALPAQVAAQPHASPSPSHDRHDRNRDGIGAGEIIAGAVILGGLAAILSSGNDRDRYDDEDWRHHGGSRRAVEQCISAVQARGGYNRQFRVTQVQQVERLRRGYRVRGDVRVRYQDGYRSGGRRRDDGTFACTTRQGRVDKLKIRGI
jgi:hypothetical protein